MPDDVRWLQRFQNFEPAFRYLSEVRNINAYTEMEIDATIQRFEVAFELAWKTLQDYLEAQGYDEYKGPKKVISKAFQDGIIGEGELWMRMNEDRNILSHAYDYDKSRHIFRNIIDTYIDALRTFSERMKHERD